MVAVRTCGAPTAYYFVEAFMVDSLSDQMRRDEARESTSGERAVRWAVVTVAAVVLFGALYFGIRVFA